MKELALEMVKKIQLDILNFVVEFCNKNDINYFMTAGTLLGAIRHNGFIPWDDDIDIGMLRADYDKFKELFNKYKNNENYKFLCNEDDMGHMYSFGKVINTKTILYELNQKNNITGVFVDIFVYDNAPDDNVELKKMYRIRDWNYRFIAIKQIKSESNFKKLLKGLINIILLPFSIDYFVKKNIKNCQKFKNKDTKRIGDFSGSCNIAVNKQTFSEYVYKEFEGKKYKVPIGYDELLRAFYGDYMEIPPIEKRVAHHNFKAYFLEK